MNTKTNDTKRQAAIKSEVIRNEKGDATGLSLTFSHGKKLTVVEGDLSDSIAYEGLWHGIKQKLVDAAAISRNPETGRSATIADKFDAVSNVYQRLLTGLWNEPREGGGNLGGILLKALCRVYPDKDAEKLKEWLAGKGEAEKTALRANPKIAEAIAAIQAEAAANAGIDSDDLLDELDAEEPVSGEESDRRAASE